MFNGTTLLTGSTGFIGQYVLRDLLRLGARVVVMLRGSQRASRLRLAAIMRPLGVPIERYLAAERVIIVSGALPDDVPAMSWGRTDRILHCAACLQIENDRRGEPFATNVQGVKALTEWATRYQIPQFHLLSTAYTCGRDCTVAPEVLHRPQPRFGTDYELSKWQAEEWAAEWAEKSGHRLTIFRPSLVVGDSDSGYTTQYGGFYQLARMIQLLSQYFHDCRHNGSVVLRLRIHARAEGRQNLVPVNYVSAAIVEIASRPELHGEIYHLTNPNPPSNQQVKEWMESYYQVCGGHFVDRLDPSASESLAESMFLQMSDVISRQMLYVPEFDWPNTKRALAGSGIDCPCLNSTTMFNLLQFAQRRNWGRMSQAAAS